jgi:drug/metabolite transporter, DME family
LAVGGGALVVITLTLGGRAALLTGLRRPLLGLTVIAAVALAICQSAFFSAVASTGVATGTVVALGTAPVVTGLSAAAAFGERLTRWWAAATGLAVFGCVVLVTADSQGTAQVSLAGVVLAAAAGTCYGVYTTAAKALLNQGVPATAAMAVTLSLGAVGREPGRWLAAGIWGRAPPPAGGAAVASAPSVSCTRTQGDSAIEGSTCDTVP